jgi:hypothetical protein
MRRPAMTSFRPRSTGGLVTSLAIAGLMLSCGGNQQRPNAPTAFAANDRNTFARAVTHAGLCELSSHHVSVVFLGISSPQGDRGHGTRFGRPHQSIQHRRWYESDTALDCSAWHGDGVCHRSGFRNGIGRPRGLFDRQHRDNVFGGWSTRRDVLRACACARRNTDGRTCVE